MFFFKTHARIKGLLNFLYESIFLLMILMALFIISAQVSSNPQDYRYQKAFKVQKLTLSDGLSQSSVRDVIQDTDGYIWFATEDGLNRFDSYQFKVYRHDHKNAKSLHENWVISLVEEPGFGIWVGTVSGLSFFDPKEQTFVNYTNSNIDLKGYINSLLYSAESVVWVATENGLFYVDRALDQVVPFLSLSKREVDEEIFSLTESKEFIYVATSNCIYRINKSNNRLTNLCEDSQLEVLKDKDITVLKIQNDLLWIGTKSGFYRFDLKINQLTSFFNDKNDPNTISSNYIQDLAIDRNATLWIATTGGLNQYIKEKAVFEHYSQQNYAEDGLSSNDVYSLYVDSQDLIWLGTYGGGVNILDPNQHQFEHLLTRTDVINTGNNNTIHGIEKDRYETLWLASYGSGLINYDLMTGEITRPLNGSNKEYDEYVYSLMIDQADRLWVGSLQELVLVDVKTKKEINSTIIVDGQKIDELDGVNRIHEDHQGQVWLGTERGLFRVDNIEVVQEVLRIELSDLTYKLPHSFSNASLSISSIVDDQDGNFWIGGYAGLVYYEVEQDEWHHYQYSINNPQSLSSNDVQVIYEDSQGFLWIGTADGLNRVIHSNVDKKTFYFERITTYEGLPNNAIYGILEDQKNQLWISTTLGLVKYAHNSVNMDSFRSLDGLSSDEFNTGAYFSDTNGRLYFGSINGITIVNNVASKTKTSHKQILFSHVKVGDRDIDVYQLNHSKAPFIVQKTDEVSIDISLVHINFDKLGTQRYRYKLAGFSDSWNHLGIGRSMFIAGLPEGQYQLIVESRLAGQVWMSQQRPLTIQVNTNFWSSTQAYYLIAFSITVFFLASLFFVASFYKNRIAKVDRKMSLEALRLRELRADNDTLKMELQQKETEALRLSKKLKIGERQLDVEKYRDAITGFYRLNYLEQITDEELNQNRHKPLASVFSHYKTIVVFELSDYVNTHNEFGPLAASDLTSKVSIDIRQKTDSRAQIFCIQNGMFLILSSQKKTEVFLDDMANLRHQIVRSEYEVANGISVNSNVSFSALDIKQANVSDKSDLLSMVDLIIQAHRFRMTENGYSSVKMELTHEASYYVQNQSALNVVALLKNKELLISKI